MFLKRDLESGEVLEEVRAQAPSPKPHSNAITWNQFLDCTEGRWLEPNPHDEQSADCMENLNEKHQSWTRKKMDKSYPFFNVILRLFQALGSVTFSDAAAGPTGRMSRCGHGGPIEPPTKYQNKRGAENCKSLNLFRGPHFTNDLEY